MNKITLTRSEAEEAYESGKIVATEPWRWGTRKSVVFDRDGKQFLVEIECHCQDGIQVYNGMTAIEVRAEERKAIVWVPA